MSYVIVTNVDAVSGVPCNASPMQAGPSFPALSGLKIEWSDQSTWPITTTAGVYDRVPRYYGTCSDEANMGLPGVLEVITARQFNTQKRAEFFARKPFASWIFDEAALAWSAPVAAPQDGKQYTWNESTTNWKEAQK